jgi:hypothetical protein
MVHGQVPFQKRNPNRIQKIAQASAVGSGEKYGIFDKTHKNFMRSAYKIQGVNFTKMSPGSFALLCNETKDWQK